VPLEPSTVPQAKGPPQAPAYVPPATPPAGAPPSGVLARLRAWRAGAKGAAFGSGVVVAVAEGARVEFGEGCAIGAGTRISVRAGTVRIGAGAVLGERCRLVAHAGIEIGEGALLGDEAVVMDFDHRYADVERPVRLQGIVADPVRIGAGARVGARAAIQRGIAVGERAQVAPLAVVTRDVPPGAIVGGVPAQTVSPSAGSGTRGGPRSRRGR
jgi:acetyltransferase-like isoleucine patch superfamily enzyme